MPSTASSYQSLCAAFEASESLGLPYLATLSPVLAGVGSVAPKALGSPLLRDFLDERGITVSAARALDGLDALKAEPDWSLALVLSPWKLEAAEVCDHLTPAAGRSGVIDTMLRSAEGALHGINTNVFGLGHALRSVALGSSPASCLILGTGATSRCAMVALEDCFPKSRIGIMGRNAERTEILADKLGAVAVEDAALFDADIVVNCTTVGETSDQAIELDLERIMRPGLFFLDLNNRTSALQTEALARGCVTASGIMMQRAVNALRAHLLGRRPASN